MMNPDLSGRPEERNFFVDENLAAGVSGRIPVGQLMSAFPKVNNNVSDLKILASQLQKVVDSNPGARGKQNSDDEMTDPAAQPQIWVSKWVDYSKYGFGYMLCNESVGVLFNDNTKLVMSPNGINVQYKTASGVEFNHTKSRYPKNLEKKMKLLGYFKRYMNKYLKKEGASVTPRKNSIGKMPYIYLWFRNSFATVMHLNNGSVQVNFRDHKKVLVCRHMEAVTYIDAHEKFRTYRFSTIIEHGCSGTLEDYIKFLYDHIRVNSGRIVT